MQRSGWFPVVLVGLLFANFLLLVILVFQIDTREERLIEQSAQLRAIAEGTERLRVEVQKLGRGGGLAAPAAAPTASPSRRWLHPEVANLLEPHDFAITAPDAKSGGRLTWLYGSDPKGLNTMIENSADVQNLATYVGAELADRMAWTDPDKYYGKVAERVEITNDNKEFTVYLRPGVKWHAPGNLDLDDPKYAWLRGEHELTTRDVDFSLQILMHPQVENGPLKSYYEDLEGWQVVDDHTFIVRWKRPYYGAIEGTLGIPLLPEFLYAYDEQGRRFPEETLGVNFNRHWYNSKGMVGTGPYRMVSYEPGVAIRLERNEDYFGEPPAIQEIVFEIFTDPNLSLLKLRSHQHDFGVLQPTQYREEIQRWETRPASERPADSPFLNGRIEHRKYVGMSYYYVGWNADRSLFRDKRVRYAMTHALNRQAIVDNVYVGLGRIPPGHFFSESPYNDPAIQPRPFDLAKARALLAEAGFSDSDGDGLLDKDLDPDDGVDRRTPFEFTLLIYASSPEMASTANIYKDDLLQIGVRMRIEEAEWSLMQKRMEERDFDAFTGGWALSWDPDPYQVWHSSQADVPKGSNMVGFRNPEADRLMVTLRATFDPEERLALLHRLHRILDDEEPYTLLVVRESVACWWDDVHRVVLAKLRPHARALAWWTDEKG